MGQVHVVPHKVLIEVSGRQSQHGAGRRRRLSITMGSAGGGAGGSLYMRGSTTGAAC